jgi:hypothetical protein
VEGGESVAECCARILVVDDTLEDYYAPWDRWFENRIYPSPQGLTIHFAEITDRRRAQGGVTTHRQRLEDLVAEHIAELRRMADLMAEREVHIAELQDAIHQLCAQLEAAGLTSVANDPLAAG